MEKLLGGLKKGLLFILSAPAGTGKTTLVRMLCQEFDCIVESVSYTTRPPRPQEVEGRDYFFVSEEVFRQKIEEGEFLEHAQVFRHLYGTSRAFVEKERQSGKHVVLVIDTQGALQLKGKLNAVFIFISPPNMEALQTRLSQRRSESETAMQERLSWAQKEMSLSSKYDYHIVNDNLAIAYQILRSILIAEEHKNH